MVNNRRKCLPDLAEILDVLSIMQIKEVKLNKHRLSYAKEIQGLMRDIDFIIKDKKIKLNARFIRLLVVLSQVNLHIWNTKETMMRDTSHFNASMKLAHQLNGIRNRIKNLILTNISSGDKSKRKTNTNTDNLRGWHISL